MKVGFQDFSIALTARRDDKVPLFRQLYLALRDEIIGGRLAPGTRLPPSRFLSERLGVARNTVITAYDQLAAEGYVDGLVGSGTRVAAELPVDSVAVAPSRRPVVEPQARPRPDRRRRGGLLRIDEPALDAFPYETMRRLLANRMREDFAGILRNDDPQGLEQLRRAIARYITAERGIACAASQIVITAGSLHGLDLVARALRISGLVACMEEPGDIAARANLVAAGARLHGARVDGHGCVVEELIAADPAARLVVITPSNQYPLGGTMSLNRRLALLDWCAKRDAIVFEDDADSEFRYTTRPLAPLKALDRHGRVVYAATFSRIIHPNIRMGYLILPPWLVGDVVAIRELSDRHPPPLEQVMVAEFITRGHFAIHVRRMRKLYRDRQAELVAALRGHLPAAVDVHPAGAGINTVVLLPSGVDDRALSQRLGAEGFDTQPLSSFYGGARRQRGLLLGSGIRIASLPEQVKRFARVIRDALPGQGGGPALPTSTKGPARRRG